MFKLIKILNSGVNVPEPVVIDKPDYLPVQRGAILRLSGGHVVNCDKSTKPEYIALADAPVGATKVTCYAVTSNMLFETVINAPAEEFKIGYKVVFALDSDDVAFGVDSDTTNGVARIVDLMGAKEIGDKVTITF